MNIKTKTISLAFLLIFISVPLFGFAKENNKVDNSNNNTNKSSKNNNICTKAFGQYIKKGWKETQGQITLSENCYLPYGIFKKLNYIPNASSTDTTPPVVTSFTFNSENTTAEIKWSTNEKTRGVVFYGTTTPVVVKATTTSTGNILMSVYSTNSIAAIDEQGLRTYGQLTLKNLSANTTYYAVLAVRDASGNITISNVTTFTTTKFVDTTAPIISSIITTINNNLLQISWKTNEPATSTLFYGTTTLNLGATSTARLNSTIFGLNHSFELPAISSTTPYRIILQSTDRNGNTRTSAEYSIFFPF